MAWTVDIQLDDDKKTRAIGRVVAIWNRNLADEFVYSERIAATGTAATAFVTRARASLAKRNEFDTEQRRLASLLEARLNA